MKKVKQLSDFLQYTKEYPNYIFIVVRNMDYSETVCVATAVRDSLNYDMYSKKNRTI